MVVEEAKRCCPLEVTRELLEYWAQPLVIICVEVPSIDRESAGVKGRSLPEKFFDHNL